MLTRGPVGPVLPIGGAARLLQAACRTPLTFALKTNAIKIVHEIGVNIGEKFCFAVAQFRQIWQASGRKLPLEQQQHRQTSDDIAHFLLYSFKKKGIEFRL